MYKFLLLFHVATAIIGFGQTFLFPIILQLPKNNSQVYFTGHILSSMGKIAKYSDYILFFTGIIMVYLGKANFHQGFINLSILLFILMRISSGIFSKKTASALFGMMNKNELEISIEEFFKKRDAFMPKLYITQAINFLIIIVMVIKPSIPYLSF